MDDDRSEVVQRTLAKGLAMLVGVAVVIAMGTFLFVKVLGLDDPGTGTGTVYAGSGPASPLPTRALQGTGGSSSDDDLGDG
ncbi:MAG TPA: hypothetical protein VF426_01490 [Marmoricola sp.]